LHAGQGVADDVVREPLGAFCQVELPLAARDLLQQGGIDGSTTQITAVSVSSTTDELKATLNPDSTLRANTKYKAVVTAGFSGHDPHRMMHICGLDGRPLWQRGGQGFDPPRLHIRKMLVCR